MPGQNLAVIADQNRQMPRLRHGLGIAALEIGRTESNVNRAVEAVATRPPPTDGKRRRMGCPAGEGPADIRSHIALDMNRKELPVGDGDAAIPVAAAGPDEPVAIGDPYRHDLVE